MLFALALIAPSSLATTSPDKLATHTYLRANLEYAQALVKNEPASTAAKSRFAASIARECSDVLAGAPKVDGATGAGPPTPRARGERQRAALQLSTIREELAQALTTGVYGPDRIAFQALATRLAPLRWSDPRIAALVKSDLEATTNEIGPTGLDVCADMKAWAESGYRTLSPASREFEATYNPHLALERPASSIESLLKPYVGPAERTLIRRTHMQQKLLLTLSGSTLHVYSHLLQTLGLPEPPGSVHQHRERVLGRVAMGDSTVIVREEPAISSGCKLAISVAFETRNRGESSSLCLSTHDSQPSISCDEETQDLAIGVPASVRTVRLQLSNGHTIVSRVIAVPDSDGGPGGVYGIAVQATKAFPVELTELDQDGRAVRTIKLAKARRCERERSVLLPKLIDLVHGATPEGEPFTIEGVLVKTGAHRAEFGLTLQASIHDSAEETFSGPGEHRAFDFSLEDECFPHSYAIIYGILAPPGDSVIAQTAEGPVALTRIELDPIYHAKGPLLYGVYHTLPSALTVLRDDGSTLYTESLATEEQEEAEFCEGYAEG